MLYCDVSEAMRRAKNEGYKFSISENSCVGCDKFYSFDECVFTLYIKKYKPLKITFRGDWYDIVESICDMVDFWRVEE